MESEEFRRDSPLTRPTFFDWSAYKAVLFDLDGVLTPTALVHTAAWRQTFDEALTRIEGPQADRRPFTDADYRQYVDGKPRYDGVVSFLSSRRISLPWGSTDDPPGFDSVCAIGNKKNELVSRLLETTQIDPYPGSLALLNALGPTGIALAVVSSSANAEAVLRSAGIVDRFSVRVDGVVAADLGLEGKPAPATFLEAARRVGSEPARAVVVEDAEAGVEAGVAGRFGAVIGVDRFGDPSRLARAGATLVVADLGELVP